MRQTVYFACELPMPHAASIPEWFNFTFPAACGAKHPHQTQKGALLYIFVVSTESRNSLDDLAATWLTTSSLLTTLGSWRLLTWRYDSVCDIRYAVFDFFPVFVGVFLRALSSSGG